MVAAVTTTATTSFTTASAKEKVINVWGVSGTKASLTPPPTTLKNSNVAVNHHQQQFFAVDLFQCCCYCYCCRCYSTPSVFHVCFFAACLLANKRRNKVQDVLENN